MLATSLPCIRCISAMINNGFGLRTNGHMHLGLSLPVLVTVATLFGGATAAEVGEVYLPSAKEQSLAVNPHSFTKEEGYAELFGDLSFAELESKTTGLYDEVAIWAAWELLMRGPDLSRRSDEKGLYDRRDSAELFFRVVERRLHVKAPSRWRNVAVEVACFEDISRTLWGQLIRDIGIEVKKADKKVKLSDGDQGNRVLVDEKWIGLPSAVIEKDHERVVVRVGLVDDGVLVAVYDPITGGDWRLSKIDQATGRLIWTTIIWGVGAYDLSGMSIHGIEARVAGDQLIIFGIDGSRIYLETVCMKTGRNLIRFCNKYSR